MVILAVNFENNPAFVNQLNILQKNWLKLCALSKISSFIEVFLKNFTFKEKIKSVTGSVTAL